MFQIFVRDLTSWRFFPYTYSKVKQNFRTFDVTITVIEAPHDSDYIHIFLKKKSVKQSIREQIKKNMNKLACK